MHSNISIFVPHIGCSNQCSFCNQRYITGTSKAPTKEDIYNAVKTAVASEKYDRNNGQIAFFGGSFTAIEREYMVTLLSAAKNCIDKGYAESIRISTRPDAIDDDVLKLLKKYGVKSIELGAQSMCDDVLKLNNRGHTANDVENASHLIKKHGFELGLQMMTGLYGDTEEKSLYTAECFVKLLADTVRIYPTIVLSDTYLAKLYEMGKYTPQTIDEAVILGARLLRYFDENNLRVIRFGLHSVDEKNLVAGPWHPSLAEICYSRIYFDKTVDMLKDAKCGKYTIYVGEKYISQMNGNKKKNIVMLENMGYKCVVKTDKSLNKYDVKIIRED